MGQIADTLLAVLAPVLPWVPESYVNWKPGATPLSTWPAVSAALVAYLSTIFGIKTLMKDRPPKRLNSLFQIHNLFLTLGSGILLVLMAEEIVPIIWNDGIFYAVCGERAWTPVSPLRRQIDDIYLKKLITDSNVTQRLEFYYIINYSLKYVELIDTVFLALKKKPLSTSRNFDLLCLRPAGILTSYPAFLHVFHHSATAALCFCQLNGKTTVVSRYL